MWVVRARLGDDETSPRIEARQDQGRWVARGPEASSPVSATRELLAAVADRCHALEPGPLHWWQEAAGPASAAVAGALGLQPDRQVLQLRRALPAEPTDLVTRAFRPGDDEQAWLVCNNAAFAWHEDQGGWDRSRLDATTHEPWFDPRGLRIHEIGDVMAGFCWTKEHHETEPALGEIFVIGVHPDFRGRGLGRALTLAGLGHLSRRGLRVGMLYVEHDNEPALSLYRSLGFTEHHRDRRFVGTTGLNR